MITPKLHRLQGAACLREELDFFDSPYGNLRAGTWRSRRLGPLTDLAFDIRLALNRTLRGLEAKVVSSPVRRILIAGIEVPSRNGDIYRVIGGLYPTKHDLDISIVKMGNRGKFENINRALEGKNLEDYEWVFIIDDDMTTPADMVDTCIFLAEAVGLYAFQPAHRFNSFAAFEISHRHWNSLVRTTHFVEIGPLTALRKQTFDLLLPFPQTRMGYGLDLHWSEICRKNKWEIGIIDAVSIRHLRPVARSYDDSAARNEGKAFLQAHGVTRRKREFLTTNHVFREIV